MRILDFDWFPGGRISEKAKESYEILYDGIVHSPRGFEVAETRVLSKILDKFEELGVPDERGGIATFRLNDHLASYAIQLEDVEYKLIAESLVAVKWSARAARRVAVAMEFFEAAPNDSAK